MANNIVDVTLNGTWQSVYTLTGIAAGTAILVQNKSSGYVLGFISPSAPSASSLNGYAISPMETVTIDTGETNYFVKGNGPIFVQVT